MSNKRIIWLEHSVLAGKILITVLTVIIYFHYFNHQSWGYFTIDPKQPLINIYTVSANGVVSREPALKNNMSYGMGISRKGIFLYNKLADIIASNKNLVWKKLNGASLSFVANATNDINNINYNDYNIGRGRFILTTTGREDLKAISEKKSDFPATYYTLIDIR